MNPCLNKGWYRSWSQVDRYRGSSAGIQDLCNTTNFSVTFCKFNHHALESSLFLFELNIFLPFCVSEIDKLLLRLEKIGRDDRGYLYNARYISNTCIGNPALHGVLVVYSIIGVLKFYFRLALVFCSQNMQNRLKH